MKQGIILILMILMAINKKHLFNKFILFRVKYKIVNKGLFNDSRIKSIINLIVKNMRRNLINYMAKLVKVQTIVKN